MSYPPWSKSYILQLCVKKSISPNVTDTDNRLLQAALYLGMYTLLIPKGTYFDSS